MKKVFTKCIGLVMALMLSTFVFSACAAKVESIAVTKMPDKTEYIVGDEFSPAGGEITATLSGGEKKTVLFTDPEVSLGSVALTVPDGKLSSEKTITVTYGGQRARFSIKVSIMTFTVSFNLGYTGAPDYGTATIKNGDLIPAPEGDATYVLNPTRTGFAFDGWYTDANLTAAFDVAKDTVTENITLYAKWTDNSVVYNNVTFNYNYYGAKISTAVQKVEEGAKAIKPTKNPTRTGYSFKGWYTAATGGAEVNFDQIITTATTIYAQWTRTATGSNTYLLEGEFIDFAGKLGAGYSGNPGGVDLIQDDITGTASGSRFIGYSYKPGMQHEFKFVADKAVADAKIAIRLAAEFKNMVITSDMISIELNGVALNYAQITLDKVPAKWGEISDFEDFTLGINSALLAGANSLVITVTNNVNWLGEGAGTIAATVPLIDCFKITTEAVIIWDGTFGFPYNN